MLRVVRKLLCTLLVFTMLFTDSFRYAVKAEEPVLTINGNDAALQNVSSPALEIKFNEPMTIKYRDAQSGSKITFYSATNLEEADWAELGSQAALPIGNYYLGYIYTYDGDTQGETSGAYGFKVVANKLATATNLVWSDTVASFAAVKKDVSGVDLHANTKVTYQVSVYKDGNFITVLDKQPYDIKDVIAANGEGSYTYKVVALAETTGFDKDGNTAYQNSDASGFSSALHAVKVNVEKGTGIDSVDPTQFVLIEGNSKPVTVVATSGFEFKDFTINENGISQQGNTISVNHGYQGSSSTTIVVNGKDVVKPTIVSYSYIANSLTATVRDNETGIYGYSFTTETNENKVTFTETDESYRNTSSHTLSFSPTKGGTYYLYVKDREGNITRSEDGYKALEIKYVNYFVNNSQSFYSSILFDGSLTLAENHRKGYVFEGWYLDEGFSSKVEQISYNDYLTSNEVTVYGKWSREQINFERDLESYNATYDGQQHQIIAAVTGEYDHVVYKWYVVKNGEASLVKESNENYLTVKNVENNNYYVVAEGYVDGSSVSATSNTFNVNIAPLEVTVVVASTSINYGDPAPSYKAEVVGAVNNEYEAGTLNCSYNQYDNATTYTITASGWTAENYTFKYETGTLTVLPLNEENKFDVSIENDQFDYSGQEIEPAVTVKYDGKELALGTDYVVSYQDNTNAGTATIVVTFIGNYDGAKTISFTINKIALEEQFTVDDSIYGEGYVVAINNPTDTTPTFFYQLSTGEDWTTIKPTDAGTYNVKAVFEESTNYFAAEISGGSFTIEQRRIVLTADSKTWDYDGNMHQQPTYTQDGEMQYSDSFNRIWVEGGIIEVGEAENIVKYEVSSSTNEDNYIIETVKGKLIVDNKSLGVPANNVWSTTKAGTATWVAVTKNNVTVGYNVSLYRIVDGQESLVETITTNSTNYDFAETMKVDAASQTGEVSYVFTVQAFATDNNNYTSSSYSSNSNRLNTIKVELVPTEGIESYTINGKTNEVLLQGETARLNASLLEGYSFDNPAWLTSFTEGAFGNRNNASTSFRVAKNLSTSYDNVVINIRAIDDLPEIVSFVGTNAEDFKSVTLTLKATDLSGLAAYMITTNGQTPSADDENWVSVTGKETTQTLTVYGKNTFYAYVRDMGGNVVSAEPVSVYEIKFERGNENAVGEMVSLLKAQNTTIVLPENGFSYTGYVFQNWSGNSGLYANASKYSANANETLTAIWTKSAYLYNVEYYFANVDGTYPNTPERTVTLTANYNETIDSTNESLNLETRGFVRDDEKKSSIVLDENGKTLKVFYKRSEYTITYSFSYPDTNEEVVSTSTYLYGASVTELEKPSYDGYLFVGWNYDSGIIPEVMDAVNINATGYFIPKKAQYTVNHYLQGLDGIYELAYSEIREGNHGDPIDLYAMDAREYTGFKMVGFNTSKNGYYGDLENEIHTSINGEQEVAINYFYDRQTYKIILNVWKNGRNGSLLFNKEWKEIKYGEAIDVSEYANADRDGWNDPVGYVLAKYIDYSTVEVPTTMPAGDLIISREFVIAVPTTYKVEVYLENETAKDYSLKETFTYEGYISQNVSVGKENTLETDQFVNYNTFKNGVDYFQYYEFDDEYEGQKLTGIITDAAEEQLVLKAYFRRKIVSVELIYHYTAAYGTSSVEFARTTLQGRWGTTVSFDPIKFFDGNGDTTGYTVKNLSIEGTKVDEYDFRNNNYFVSYTSRLEINDAVSWPSAKLSSEASLTAAYTYKFGQKSTGEDGYSNYLNVYYNQIDRDKTYHVDMGYQKKSLKYAKDSTFNQFVVKVNGVDKLVRVVNKSEVFNSTRTPSTAHPTYPALNEYLSTYQYGDLKEGYTAVTINGGTYYINANDNYLYVIDGSEQFFYGNRVSYDFLSTKDTYNTGKPGYDNAKDYVSYYIGQYSDETSKTYDENAIGTSIYNPGFSPIMYGNGQYAFTFEYKTKYRVTYILNGLMCRDEDHIYFEGSKVKIGCDHPIMEDKEGYEIVWYTDDSFTTPAEDFEIHQNTNLYGRYVNNRVSYYQYVYYQLANPIVYEGVEYDYIDKEIAGLLVEKGILTIESKIRDIEYIDHYGVKQINTVVEPWYFYNGELVLREIMVISTTFTEVSMDYMSYALENYHYDTKNPNNNINGYIGVSGESLELSVYYERDKHNVTIISDTEETKSVQEYSIGNNVTLLTVEKEGYDFVEWAFTRYDEETDSYVEYTPTINEDGSFVMPEFDIVATAVWKEASFTTYLTYYFQKTDLSYPTNLLEEIKELEPVENTVEYNGLSLEVVEYYKDGKLYVTKTVVGTMSFYFLGEIAEYNSAVATIEFEVTTNKGYRNGDYLIKSPANFTYKETVITKEDTVYHFTDMDAVVTGHVSIKVEYYFTRDQFNVLVSPFSIDGGEHGVTAIYETPVLNGATENIKISVDKGYELVGIYSEDAFTGEGALREDYKVNGSLLTMENEYSFMVEKNTHIAVVTKPLDVQIPELTISGNNEYVYGYKNSESNILIANVDFGDEKDDNTYVTGYQWYMNGQIIEGATSATLIIEEGLEVGDYVFECIATVSRRDNGRVASTNMASYDVTVIPADLKVTITDYNESYDGNEHSISVKVDEKIDKTSYVIYYATEPLDESNFATVGSLTIPSFKNVMVDENEQLTEATVYVYVHATNGNYNDVASSGTVTINPLPVTLKATESIFTKVYNGNKIVSGPSTHPGTELYEFVNSDCYEVVGLLPFENKEVYIIDCVATYNYAHVDTATAVTVENIVLLEKTGDGVEVEYNYYFEDDYVIVMSAAITPCPIDIEWDKEEPFVYNGTSQGPIAVVLDGQSFPEGEAVIEAIEITGWQKNVGKHSATAVLEDSEAFIMSDYAFTKTTCPYEIVAREIVVELDELHVEYDGLPHSLTVQPVANLVENHTYTVSAPSSKVSSGLYEQLTASKLIIKDEKGIIVTDNYKVSYQPSTLEITKKELTIDGVLGVNKDYDGNTDASLNLLNAKLNGVIEGDEVSANILSTTVLGQFENAEAGKNKKVDLTYDGVLLDGEDADNYYINFEKSQQSTTADITSKVIKATVESTTVIYGETPVFNVSFDGFIAEAEKVEFVHEILTANENKTAGLYAVTDSIGVYDIIVSFMEENAVVGNYKVEFDSSNQPTLTVLPREISLADNNSNVTKTFDNTVTVKAGSVVQGKEFVIVKSDKEISGIVNNDTVTVSFKANYTDKNVLGEKNSTVRLTDLSIDNSNYVLVIDSLDLKGTITPALVTVSAVNKSKTYGENDPELTVKVTGTLGNDQIVYEINREAGENVREGGYLITVTGQENQGNYTVVFENGVFTINKKKIIITALDKNMVYGDTVPEFTKVATGFVNDEDESVINGYDQLTYVCKDAMGNDVSDKTVSGTYPIQPVVSTLTSDNYYFEPVNGTLTITLKSITLDGIAIEVEDKYYDGTATVDLGDIRFVTTYNFLEGITEADKEYLRDNNISGVVAVSGSYDNKNVSYDNNGDVAKKNVTVNYKLDNYLASRYQLTATSDTTTAKILPVDLTITAVSQNVKYAQEHKPFTVTSTGLVHNEKLTDADFTGELTYVCARTVNSDVLVDEEGNYVGYPITVSGLSNGNYNISYVAGEVVVTPNQLKPSTPTWSDSEAGKVTWSSSEAIGLVEVAGYNVELLKNGEVKETYNNVNSNSLDLKETIRTLGAGEYTVNVTAIASEENNENKKNVKDSIMTASAKLYVANVEFVFATDTITSAGKGEATVIDSVTGDPISINEKRSYVVLPNEKDIPLAATLINSTGYTVKSVTSTNKAVTNVTNMLENTSYTGKFDLANNNTATAITIVLTLAARAANSTVTIPEVEALTYNYPQGPNITATCAVVEGDNITTDGYIYHYQWQFIRNIAKGWENVGSDEDNWTVMTGLNAATNVYKVRVIVTATRKDNSQFKEKIYSNIVTVNVNKAPFSTAILFVEGNEWIYGESRKPISVTANPENAPVTYYYSNNGEDWTTKLITDAGTWYVKANVATSDNYKESNTPVTTYTIHKNRLATPENLGVDRVENKAMYGIIHWDSVNGYKENAGANPSDSRVTVTYLVKLYDTSTGLDVLVKEYTTAATSINIFDDITANGKYKFTVQAMSSNTDNVLDSYIATSEIFNININIVGTGKVYDGQATVLSTDYNTENATYQWYKEGKAIEGATSATFPVTFVEESGLYSVVVTDETGVYYTLTKQITITARNVTIDSASDHKTYDAKPLTNGNVYVNEDTPIPSTDTLVTGTNGTVATGTITNVDENDVVNTIENVVIAHGDKIVYQSGATNNNYIVTLNPGKLHIDPLEGVVVTITGNNDTKTYDGKPHTVTGYAVSINNDLFVEGDIIFDGNASVTRTNAGTTNMQLSADNFKTNNHNFRNVRFVIAEDGYLTINPLTGVVVEITGNAETITYDGNEHTVTGYTTNINNSLFTNNDIQFSGDASVTRTVVGKTMMELKDTMFTTANKNFDGVTFKVVEDGYVEIVPLENVVVKVTGNNLTATYDGKNHSVTGYTLSINNSLYKESDVEFNATAYAERVIVGTTTMNLKATDFANTNNNFKNVKFELVEDGYVKINPLTTVVVEITGNNDTKTYDGQSHKVEGYKVAINNPLFKESDIAFNATAIAERVNAGTTKMGLSADMFASTNDNFANVTFTIVADGYMTINPLEGVVVEITGNNDTKIYDGNSHKATGYTVKINNSLFTEGDIIFNGKAEASRTSAGTTKMGLKADLFSTDNNNFKDVTFTVVADGYMRINPLEGVVVEITGNSDTKTYDGKSHKATGYTVKINNSLFKEDDIVFTGRAEAVRTVVGTTKMNLKDELFSTNNENFKDVTFTVVADGYMTINPVEGVVVKVTGNNLTVTYDKKSHTATGYTVEINNPLFTEEDIVFDGSALATRTNVGTTYMHLSTSQFSTENVNFKDVTFELVEDGYVTINPVEGVIVEIVGNNTTVTYDGKPHTATGYTVEINNKLFTEADIIFDGEAEVERTEEGTTNMNLLASMFSTNNTNFKDVKFELVEDGYVKINPLTNVVVKITGNNDTKTYDGQSHKIEGYKVEINNPLFKESDIIFNATAIAERVNAGTTKMGLKDEYFSTENKNFKDVTFMVVADGYMTINPIEGVVVKVTGNNDTKTYDGQSHSAIGYTVEINHELFTEDDIVFEGEALAIRTNVGTTNMKLSSSMFTTNNENFKNVQFELVADGYMTIDPLEGVVVKVTGNNDTLTYDGTSHTVTGYTVDINNELFTENDIVFEGTASATRTNVGTTNMKLNVSMFATNNTNFKDVTFELVADGYLTINPLEGVVVKVTGNNDTKTYDGQNHSVNGYTVEISNNLFTEEDIIFTGEAFAERTNAGTTNMNLTASMFLTENTNFADVTFVIEKDGYMTINPLEGVVVKVTGNNDTKTYDGLSHKVEGYTVEINNQLFTEDDIIFTGEALAERTNVGTTEMNLSASQFSTANTNFKDVQFELVEDGYMTIVTLDTVVVKIIGNNDTKTYDGNIHAATGYKVEINNPLFKESDIKFTGAALAERVDVGTTYMHLTSDMYVNNNENFDKVVFTIVEDGYMTINPLEGVVVKVTGNNDTKTYDGTKHQAVGYTVEINNNLFTENDIIFTGEAFAERTNVGTTEMNLSTSQFSTANTNFKDVAFELVADGYMTVTPLEGVVVKVTGNNDTKTYDGLSHKAEGYTVEINNQLFTEDDIIFTGEALATRTNVGTTEMNLSTSMFSTENDNFKDVQFELVADGYMTINPLEGVVVTITGNNDTKTYDGQNHSVNGYTVEINNNLFTEEDIIFAGEALAERTNVGTTGMNLSASQFSTTNTNFADVTFVVEEDGYMTINPLEGVVVKVTGNNDTKVYDGLNHKVEGYTVEINNKLFTENDVVFVGSAVAERTNAGTTYMQLSAEDFSSTNGNFKDVTFELVADGYMTITPLEGIVVTITGNNDTKVYDGQSHKAEGYTVDINNPLFTENDIIFTGEALAEQLVVGTDYMNLVPSMFSTKNDNFKDVTFELVADGYMTITPLEGVVVKVTGNNDTKTYDGQSHKAEGYTVEINNQLFTENDIIFTGDALAERTNVGTTNMNLAVSMFTTENANFKDVTFVIEEDGYMTINPLEGVVVKVTGNNDTKTYDGLSHKVEGYTVEINNQLFSENGIIFTGKALAERTNAGTTNMNLAVSMFTTENANFKDVTFVIEKDGYMTINPLEGVVVKVTGNNDTKTYDGLSHKAEGYKVEINNNLFIEEDIIFTGDAFAERTNVGTTNMNLSTSQFSTANTNFKDVQFELVEDGYMTINPLEGVVVKVTGNNGTFAYNGKDQKVEGYTVDINNDLFTEDDIIFTGVCEAIRRNAGTTEMLLKASQFTTDNENFKDVTFEIEKDGYITVVPNETVRVKIIGHNDTAIYDGVEHEVAGYDVEISYAKPFVFFANEDEDDKPEEEEEALYLEEFIKFTGTAYAARTDAGTTYMNLTSDMFENTSENFANVVFTVDDGYMEINPLEGVVVTITGNNLTVRYDGNNHSVEGYTVEISDELFTEDDIIFDGEAYAERVALGQTNMELTEEMFTTENENFKDVQFIVIDGYVKVVKYIPNTGDHMQFYLATMLTSGMGLIGTIILKKKKEEELIG